MKKFIILLFTVFCIVTLTAGIYADETQENIMSTTIETVSPKESIPISIDLTKITEEGYSVVLQTSFAVSCYFENSCTFDGLSTTFVPDGTYTVINGTYTLGASTVETEITINCQVIGQDGTVIKEEVLTLPIQQATSDNSQTPEFNGGNFSAVSFSSGAGISVANDKYLGSPDNYLKSLSVEDYELSTTFNTTNSTYFITVGADVNKISVSCKANSSSAYTTVYGNTDLKTGMNKVLIAVTSESGSTRTYRIYVTKEAASNEEEK